MANAEHIAILKKGVDRWNKWREDNPSVDPDLSRADLSRLTDTQIKFANLARADLSGTNLDYAYLRGADLREARLCDVLCHNSSFIEADCSGANFQRAKLGRANLYRAVCVNTDFSGGFLGGASLVETQVEGACFDNCEVYGLSAWGLRGHPRSQNNLIVTPPGEHPVTVDRLEVAQLVFTFLSNPHIRDVIDTIVKKAVLILGRFSEERIAVLNGLKTALRAKGYVPILFDFTIPASRNVTETVKVLAGLAKFVLADVTDATEVRAELHNIVPDFPSLPVQPLVLEGKGEFVSLTAHLALYPWLKQTLEYRDLDHLLASLDNAIIRLGEIK
jgi:hypothetical protein